MKRLRWQTILLIGFSLILLLFFIYISAGRNKAAMLVGKKAPDFTLPDENENLLTLSSLQGSRIWLIYWMMDCIPCRNELEYVQEEVEKGGGSSLAVAVNLDTVSTSSREWLKKLNPSYLTLFDPAQSTAKTYSLLIFPANFFIDEQGIVRDYIAGFHPYLKEKATEWMKTR